MTREDQLLRNRLEGEAAIHKRLLDREHLKDPNIGVKYLFKSFLRPLFVKGAANVFLYRFPAVHELASRQWRHASLDYQISAFDTENARSLERYIPPDL